MSRRRSSAALLALGLAQMAGDVLHLPALKAVGFATAASPAPRVFTTVRGMEGFSTRFFLEWRDRSGREHSLALTPEVYARLRGPYNRRNVYGAALAAGPVLAADRRTQALFNSVAAYALCAPAPVLTELGLDPDDVVPPLRVRYEPVAGSRWAGLPGVIEAPCP